MGNKDNDPSKERNIVKRSIVACEMKLAAAEDEVKNLLQMHNHLVEVLNNTSPIMKSLPLDILTEIFSIACENVTNLDYGFRPVQFLLGAVCRAWRNIAWSIPRLWSTIYISFSKDRYRTQEYLLRKWIGRTARCPLRLHLSVYSTSFEWEPPTDLFHTILPTCDRWISFMYTYPSINLPLALKQQRSVDLKFPMLNSLLVRGRSERSDGLQREDKWAFNCPPQLRQLDVRGRRKFDLGLNWASLTHLTAAFDPIGCISVLALPHSLQSLSLCVLSTLEPTASNNTAQYHPPHLTSLIIDGGARSVGRLLRLMTLPALQELNIDIYDDTTNYAWVSDLTELAQRSNFALAKLVIKQAITRNENQIMDILSTMPSIECLELDCSDISTFVLSDQTINQLNPSVWQTEYNWTEFLPNLTTFRYAGSINFTLDCLMKMIQKRFVAIKSRLRPSRRDGLGDFSTNTPPGAISDILKIDIVYRNVWHQNPKEFQTFYMTLSSLISQGFAFNLELAGSDQD